MVIPGCFPEVMDMSVMRSAAPGAAANPKALQSESGFGISHIGFSILLPAWSAI